MPKKLKAFKGKKFFENFLKNILTYFKRYANIDILKMRKVFSNSIIKYF